MNRSTLPIAPPAPPAVNITNATLGQALKAAEYLRHFINPDQMSVILGYARRSEDRQFFRDKLCELAAIVASMPGPYATNGQGENAIIWLHYFAGGSASWYITERDNVEGEEQHQAHGLADLFGDGGERGYISIAEILANRGEIDLHWTPCSLAELREKREGRKPKPLPAAEAAAVAEFNQAEPPISREEGSWKRIEAKYNAGDRSWMPCTLDFWEEMLNVLPPIYGPNAHGFGMLFAVSEAWKHDREGHAVYLWLRNLPKPACRMASRSEINEETKAAK
jgi:hypothetical protein